MTRLDNPTLWRLTLRLGRDELCYCLTPAAGGPQWHAGRLALPPGNAPWLRRIEDAIYADEAAPLVDDFARVDIIVDTPSITIVPEPLAADPQRRQQLLQAAVPQFTGDVEAAKLGQSEMAVVFGTEPGLLGFARRTWPNSRLHHPLSVLARYMVAPDRHRLIAAMVTGNRIAVIAADGTLLHAANVFDFRHPDDAAFFILSLLKLTGFDAATAFIEIAGDTAPRQAIEERLRHFVQVVMPAIPPAELAARGADAMNYPLDLMILSI